MPTPSKALMISLIIRSAIVLGIIVVYWYSSRQLTKIYHFRIILGIDALGDMRHICGTTVAEGKDKFARIVKVVILNMFIFFINLIFPQTCNDLLD